MSAAGVQKAIDRIADDLYALATLVLEDDTVSMNTKVNRNTLKNSILRGDLYVEQAAADNVVLQAFFNHYVVYLEWDRPERYGRQPPISALKDWAEKNGIDTDASTLYAISYAIWRDGHKGRPIFATMDKHLDGLYMNDWADDLYSGIIDNIDKFFNS